MTMNKTFYNFTKRSPQHTLDTQYLKQDKYNSIVKIINKKTIIPLNTVNQFLPHLYVKQSKKTRREKPKMVVKQPTDNLYIGKNVSDNTGQFSKTFSQFHKFRCRSKTILQYSPKSNRIVNNQIQPLEAEPCPIFVFYPSNNSHAHTERKKIPKMPRFKAKLFGQKKELNEFKPFPQQRTISNKHNTIKCKHEQNYHQTIQQNICPWYIN